MKIGIIGDVHNNYNRLEKILKDIHNEVDVKIQLGDISGGRYAHIFRKKGFERSIGLVIKYGVIVVKGNHDSETLEKRNHISKDSQDFLKQLPDNYVFEEMPEILFRHKPPSGRNEIPTLIKFKEEMQIMEKEFDEYKTIIYAHAHISSIVSQELENSKHIQRILSPIPEKQYYLKDDYRYLINVGSVSKLFEPGRYLILDLKKKELIFRKIK